MRSLAAVAGYVHGSHSRSLVVAALVAGSLVLGTDKGAHAGYIVSGQSTGVAISSNLSVLSLANANISINSVGGSAPNPYSSSQTINAGVTISQGGYNLPILGTPETLLSGTTGLLTTSVSSNVTGSSTSGLTTASTTINNLNLNVLASNIVSIGATTLTSSASVAGIYGALTPTGSSTINGLSIKVLGLDVTSLIQASAGVLVDISGLTGLKIGIDVTTTSGDGILTSGAATDNIILEFNNAVTLDGVLNGSLVIGQTTATETASPATAVPEPSSVAMMGMGLVLSGAFGARRVARKSRLARA